jgi:hypothetical protein
LRLTWDPDLHAIDSETLRGQLLAATPRILIDDIGATNNSVLIDPFNLSDEEATTVGATLAVALERATSTLARSARSTEPPADFAGNWTATIEFGNGRREHRFQVLQDGAAISGSHQLSYATAKLQGQAESTRASFESTHTLEGNLVRFAFRSTWLDANTMEGVVIMGSSTPHTQGPVAFGQFGQAKWRASRTR